MQQVTAIRKSQGSENRVLPARPAPAGHFPACPPGQTGGSGGFFETVRRELRLRNYSAKTMLVQEYFNPKQSPNTAYTLRVYTFALRDIAPFGRNVVYAGNVMGKFKKQHSG